jgi:competence protein ComEC
MSCKIQGKNYYVGFLSPISGSINKTYYDEFNLISNPTDQQVNNLSPMIYLTYNGVRFLFTGDADKLQEQKIIEYYKSNIIDLYHKDRVNLYDIDFLKVGHHGDEDSSSQEFLDILKPKNAIISVGGNNVYGHPSTRVINRITTTNENCRILRTDVLGNVYVSVDKNGEYKISNQK